MKFSGITLLLTRAAILRSPRDLTVRAACRLSGMPADLCEIQDSRTCRDPELAKTLTTVVNWAYRGKHADGDKNAWTGERHLLSGIRTSVEDVQDMLVAARAQGPEGKALFVARQDNTIVGSVHVERSSSSDEAEIGFFSVDPDLQGQGIGKQLLQHAGAGLRV